MTGRYRASYRSEPKNVAIARHAVADFVRACGFDRDEVAEIELAAGEALASAAEHGLSRQGSSFSIHSYCTDDALIVEVRDTGDGFVAQNRGDASPKLGFGVTIIRSLMNEITYSQSGSCVRLLRRRTASMRDGHQIP